MKRETIIRRCRKLLIPALALLLVLPMLISAYAAEGETAQGTGSIHYIYELEGTAISDAAFRLYRVAEADLAGCYTDSTRTALSADAAAEMTERYNTGMTPVASGKTDADGALDFTDLAEGLYLITGDASEAKDGTVYYPTSILAMLPGLTDSGESTMDLTVYGKPAKKDFTVEKKWAGDSASSRPESIEVTLSKNGKLVETIKLTPDENGKWTYTWPDLDPNAKYTVNEINVPSGYTASVSGSVITNTYKTSSLPKTGQLWWPVGLLGILGIVCIGIGLARRSRSKRA